MNEREELMRRLQALQFSMYDLALFLDTHPSNAEALRRYRELSARQETVKQQYEASYGALTHEGAADGERWSYVDTPFPWEC